VKKIRQKTVETGRENFCALHDAQHQVITMKVEMRSLLRQRNAAGRPTHFSRKKESEGAHASCLQRLRKEKPKRKGKKRKKERKKERKSEPHLLRSVEDDYFLLSRRPISVAYSCSLNCFFPVRAATSTPVFSG
jgi:hypothetical protein